MTSQRALYLNPDREHLEKGEMVFVVGSDLTSGDIVEVDLKTILSLVHELRQKIGNLKEEISKLKDKIKVHEYGLTR